MRFFLAILAIAFHVVVAAAADTTNPQAPPAAYGKASSNQAPILADNLLTNQEPPMIPQKYAGKSKRQAATTDPTVGIQAAAAVELNCLADVGGKVFFPPK
ncbi:hypothetical protein HDU78_007051 [Chytriomyces hyalinus]|nr:hypothetical protein HDU78_007051 [Chytriomyces hyalinus]KAJ3267235.1 hypothetical protein HDU77_003315 [Chytriomyces hyalinus]